MKIWILNIRFSLAQFCFEGLSTVPPVIENDWFHVLHVRSARSFWGSWSAADLKTWKSESSTFDSVSLNFASRGYPRCLQWSKMIDFMFFMSALQGASGVAGALPIWKHENPNPQHSIQFCSILLRGACNQASRMPLGHKCKVHWTNNKMDVN